MEGRCYEEDNDLHEEEGPVEVHVNQIGHEGDLGDGCPAWPTEKLGDRPTKTTTAGKDQPGEG